MADPLFQPPSEDWETHVPEGWETHARGGPQRLDVAVVSDIPIILLGLQAMLDPFADRVRVSGRPVCAVRRTSADVTLLHPGRDTLVMMSSLADPGNGRVLLYACNLPSGLVDVAKANGCAGYVDPAASADELLDAIEDVAQSHPGQGGASAQEAPLRPDQVLSPREAEVIDLIGQGLTNQDICDRVHLSLNTVKGYIRSAYKKVGVTRRSEAVRWGIENDPLTGADARLRPSTPTGRAPAAAPRRAGAGRRRP